MIISLILALFAASPSGCLAVNPTISSRDSPHSLSGISNAGADSRTTQHIVWSCIATTFACTWVAIHPNLPDPRCSKWSQFRHRITIMVLTIFAPEFILIWALRQRLGAQRIVKEYNSDILGGALRTSIHSSSSLTRGVNFSGEKKQPLFNDIRAWFRDIPPPHERQKWTLTHGFYVQMGGFLFYENTTDWPIRVLSFPELLDLVKSDLVDAPMITEEELCDKSKGDVFAKLFVVIQTTWFMVQCIVRWIIKLPVTELEILTFSFAVLNVVTYALWFEKPQNVTVGSRIRMRKNRAGSSRERASTIGRRSSVGEMDITDNPEAVLDEEELIENVAQDDNFHDPQHAQRSPHIAIQATLEPANVGIKEQPSRSVPAPKPILTTLSLLPRSLYLIGKGILGAELFKQFRRVVLGPTPTIRGRTMISTQTIRKETSAETLAFSVIPGSLTVGTFDAYETSNSNNGKSRLILFTVTIGLLFGGLHLVPWKFAFPSRAESLIWRASALYTMLNPVLLSIPLALFTLLQYHSTPRSRLRSALIKCSPWVMPPVRVITGLAIPLYILTRLSIIIIAFTTLRSLPEDVYREIPWSSYIPHI